MQEEVENRTVNLAISTTKLTFRTIVNGYTEWKRNHRAKIAQKTAQLLVGKQSIKELIGQNQGACSIPIPMPPHPLICRLRVRRASAVAYLKAMPFTTVGGVSAGTQKDYRTV